MSKYQIPTDFQVLKNSVLSVKNVTRLDKDINNLEARIFFV